MGSEKCPVTQLVRVLEAVTAQSHEANPQARLPPTALGSEEDLFIALSLHSLPLGPKEMTNPTGTAQFCSADLVRKELLPPSEHLGKKSIHNSRSSVLLFCLSDDLRTKGLGCFGDPKTWPGELRFISFSHKHSNPCYSAYKSPTNVFQREGFLRKNDMELRTESILSPALTSVGPPRNNVQCQLDPPHPGFFREQ